MKRKPPQFGEAATESELLESAKSSLDVNEVSRPQKCIVCSAPCAPNSTEGLCWVCRRLKISAWRDSDQQVVQE